MRLTLVSGARGSHYLHRREIQIGTRRTKEFLPLAVAHELAHWKSDIPLSEVEPLSSKNCILLRELEAWAYAFQKAPRPITRKVRQVVATCLESYVDTRGLCRHSSARLKVRELCDKLRGGATR